MSSRAVAFKLQNQKFSLTATPNDTWATTGPQGLGRESTTLPGEELTGTAEARYEEGPFIQILPQIHFSGPSR